MEWNGICKTHEHHGYHQRNLPSPAPMPAQFHIYPSLCGPANPTNQLNQPTNQPINQQTNQDQPTTTNQPTNQPTNHTIPHQPTIIFILSTATIRSSVAVVRSGETTTDAKSLMHSKHQDGRTPSQCVMPLTEDLVNV
jgi:hypothetical protein